MLKHHLHLLRRSYASTSQTSSCKPGSDTNLAGSSDPTRHTTNEAGEVGILLCFLVFHLHNSKGAEESSHLLTSTPQQAYLGGRGDFARYFKATTTLILLSIAEAQLPLPPLPSTSDTSGGRGKKGRGACGDSGRRAKREDEGALKEHLSLNGVLV